MFTFNTVLFQPSINDALDIKVYIYLFISFISSFFLLAFFFFLLSPLPPKTPNLYYNWLLVRSDLQLNVFVGQHHNTTPGTSIWAQGFRRPRSNSADFDTL